MKGYNKHFTAMFIAILSLCYIASAMAQDFYKVVKPDGSIEYTQNPPAENAKPVDLPGLSVISPEKKLTEYKPEAAKTSAVAIEEPKRNYRGVSITSPLNEASIWGTGATVTVEVSLPGPLFEDDTVQLILDGEKLPAKTATTFELKEIDRGEHTVRATILDNRSQVVANTQAVTFHMKQATVTSGSGN